MPSHLSSEDIQFKNFFIKFFNLIKNRVNLGEVSPDVLTYLYKAFKGPVDRASNALLGVRLAKPSIFNFNESDLQQYSNLLNHLKDNPEKLISLFAEDDLILEGIFHQEVKQDVSQHLPLMSGLKSRVDVDFMERYNEIKKAINENNYEAAHGKLVALTQFYNVNSTQEAFHEVYLKLKPQVLAFQDNFFEQIIEAVAQQNAEDKVSKMMNVYFKLAIFCGKKHADLIQSLNKLADAYARLGNAVSYGIFKLNALQLQINDRLLGNKTASLKFVYDGLAILIHLYSGMFDLAKTFADKKIYAAALNQLLSFIAKNKLDFDCVDLQKITFSAYYHLVKINSDHKITAKYAPIILHLMRSVEFNLSENDRQYFNFLFLYDQFAKLSEEVVRLGEATYSNDNFKKWIKNFEIAVSNAFQYAKLKDLLHPFVEKVKESQSFGNEFHPNFMAILQILDNEAEGTKLPFYGQSRRVQTSQFFQTPLKIEIDESLPFKHERSPK